MTAANEQYAYFAVTGTFDPAEITMQVGVPPTECWRVGDIHPLTRIPRTFSRWCLHSRLARAEPLESHVRDVIAQLDASREPFQRVSREFGGWVQLVGYFYTGYPGLSFERDITEGLARYSLGVDFDFYGLASDS